MFNVLEKQSILKSYLLDNRDGKKQGSFFQRGETEKVMRRAEKVASRGTFTPSEGKNERSKNAGYEAEMGIFYPHSCRKVKKNIQKENGKVDEFQNILSEKSRINKDKKIREQLLIHL